MFGNMGYGELLIVGFLILLLFGAKRLPEIGSSLGKSIRAFKSSIKDIQEELPSNDELYRDQPATPRRKTEAPTENKTYAQDSQQHRNSD
ncbi:MAG: hypothetical protein A3F83_07765 [Candidatus Glassbacteria bacterium RIFCSPLOWO2_12_FULL_58_11]|uniref:Sec-independent protein translocase protein TatA n=1 Tax=Candidatus Glassbacteria bacterium RIFCSPLOWO2_12_FULL_58_11 TaxID=1817867 RepID=A0A1F5YS03_9BACT|nr:MAG: hypothetical protein A3F83_07765 [Candidatus Glassbacteria bacterium RIFCSPLOWO2_12_FULL_58_11]